MAEFPRQSLCVLLLEDSSADAELIVGELRQAGFDPVCQRVERAKGKRVGNIGAVNDERAGTLFGD